MGNTSKTFLTQMYISYKGKPTLTTVYTDGTVEFPTGEESHLTPTQLNLVYQKLSEAKEQRASEKMDMERKLHEQEASAIAEADKRVQQHEETALAEARKRVQELEEAARAEAEKRAKEQEESALAEVDKRVQQHEEAALAEARKRVQELEESARAEAEKRAKEQEENALAEANKRVQQHEETALEEARKRVQELEETARAEADKRVQQHEETALEEAKKRVQELEEAARAEAEKRIQQQEESAIAGVIFGGAQDDKALAEAEKRAQEAEARAQEAERRAQEAEERALAAEKEVIEAGEDEDTDIDELIQPEEKAEKKNIGKLVLSTLGLVVVCGGVLFGSRYVMDNYLTHVSVAQFAESVAKDQQITADNLAELQMPESVYQELTKAAPGEIVLWKDADTLIGQYAAMDAISGQYITTDYVTDSITENPWKATATGKELVNLNFDQFELDEIFPGSHISIHAVVTPQDSSNPQVMTIEQAAKMGEKQGVAASTTTTVQTEQAAEDTTADTTTETTETATADTAKETETVVESTDDGVDAFADIAVVDLKNEYNDSIYDLYSSLAAMTSEKRRAYLTERANSSNAATYRETLTPTVMVLALGNDQAKSLSVVKNMSNATLSYASIPTGSYESSDEQYSILMKFKEVDRDIREIFSAARTK